MHNFAGENLAHGLAAHADPSDTTSVPRVEILEPYIFTDFARILDDFLMIVDSGRSPRAPESKKSSALIIVLTGK